MGRFNILCLFFSHQKKSSLLPFSCLLLSLLSAKLFSPPLLHSMCGWVALLNLTQLDSTRFDSKLPALVGVNGWMDGAAFLRRWRESNCCIFPSLCLILLLLVDMFRWRSVGPGIFPCRGSVTYISHTYIHTTCRACVWASRCARMRLGWEECLPTRAGL